MHIPSGGPGGSDEGLGSTGAIGPLRYGVSLTDIAATLGPPWDIGRVSKRRRWPHLFSYGDVELCVCRCRLITSMCVQTWRDTISLPDPHQPGTVVSHPGQLTHREITSALEATGCRWQSVTLNQPPGQTALRTEPTGTAFTFRTEGTPEPLLESAGIWMSTHRCVPPAPDAPDDGFGTATAAGCPSRSE
ncbi:hypothetical protein [Streptomyces aurantiacus]|uniref:hypothetical protein n=1 Tax=Streptomyces aurantiacus TaxID=47760 RepID=UPI000A5F1564|nr:hypothetical protein [Streptomyces aurantiacus]